MKRARFAGSTNRSKYPVAFDRWPTVNSLRNVFGILQRSWTHFDVTVEATRAADHSGSTCLQEPRGAHILCAPCTPRQCWLVSTLPQTRRPAHAGVNSLAGSLHHYVSAVRFLSLPPLAPHAAA